MDPTNKPREHIRSQSCAEPLHPPFLLSASSFPRPPPSGPHRQGLPPWDRTFDAVYHSRSENDKPQGQFTAFESALDDFFAQTDRERPGEGYFRLPDPVRSQITQYVLAPHRVAKPIRLNKESFNRDCWRDSDFCSLTEALGPLRSYCRVSFAFRADILTAFLSNHIFHAVFSPYIGPRVSPLATMWLNKYGPYMQNIVIELDLTRLGLGPSPEAPGLLSGIERIGQLLEGFVNSQLQRDEDQPLVSLVLLCRRFLGTRFEAFPFDLRGSCEESSFASSQGRLSQRDDDLNDDDNDDGDDGENVVEEAEEDTNEDGEGDERDEEEYEDGLEEDAECEEEEEQEEEDDDNLPSRLSRESAETPTSSTDSSCLTPALTRESIETRVSSTDASSRLTPGLSRESSIETTSSEGSASISWPDLHELVLEALAAERPASPEPSLEYCPDDYLAICNILVGLRNRVASVRMCGFSEEYTNRFIATMFPLARCEPARHSYRVAPSTIWPRLSGQMSYVDMGDGRRALDDHDVATMSLPRALAQWEGCVQLPPPSIDDEGLTSLPPVVGALQRMRTRALSSTASLPERSLSGQDFQLMGIYAHDMENEQTRIKKLLGVYGKGAMSKKRVLSRDIATTL